jgi:hypothetical protein
MPERNKKMITESMIYWVLILDNINFCFVFFMFCSLGAAIAAGLVVKELKSNQEDYEEIIDKKDISDCYKELTKERLKKTETNLNTALKIFKVSFCSAILCLLLITFVPSTKQMAMIKVIPLLANSEAVQALGRDGKEIYQMGIKAIKETLKGEK